MNEIGDMRGSSILRYCDKCNSNRWHKIDMCGVCGSTNTGNDRQRCRACGGMFELLINDHPLLQGQCAKCVKLYEKEIESMSPESVFPRTDHKIPMPECKPSISPEKTGSAGPEYCSFDELVTDGTHGQMSPGFIVQPIRIELWDRQC